jgi:hypothetical protein
MNRIKLAEIANARRAGVFLILVLLFLLALPALPALSAGNYDLSWFSVDGGGGTSHGDGYTLSGTIGQPDAGVLNGGNYALAGGIWGSGEATGGNHTIYLPAVLR